MSGFRNLLMEKAAHSEENAKLPKEYKQLDYIASDGNQYIDLGWRVNGGGMQVVYHYACVENPQLPRETLHYLFGASNSAYSGGLWYAARSWGEDMPYYFWRGDYTNNQWSQSFEYCIESNDVCKSIKLPHPSGFIAYFEPGKFLLYKRFKELPVRSATMGTFDTSLKYNMYLFAANRAGTEQYRAPHRLFYASFAIEGELIHEYIPCYRVADRKPGIYDVVTNTFLVNNGTGEFTMGPEHVEIEGIDANGIPYVDMDVKLPDGTPVYFAKSNLTNTGLAQNPFDAGDYYRWDNLENDLANDILGGTWTTCSIEAMEALTDLDKYKWTATYLDGIGVVICSLKSDSNKFLVFCLAGNMGKGGGIFNKGNTADYLCGYFTTLHYYKNDGYPTMYRYDAYYPIRPVLTKKLSNWG